MADNTSELLIKIKTILESQGVDQAKTKINEMINSQSGSNAVLALAKKAQDEAAKAQAAGTKEMESATRAAWALRMAANGSNEGLKGLSNVAAGMGANLGALVSRISMVGAAFAAGWKVGTMIREQLIDPLIEAEEDASDFAESARGAAEKARELNAVSLTALAKELSGIKVTSDELIASIERVYKRQQELDAARTDTRMARIIQTMPEGPERDKAIAGAKLAKELSSIEQERSLATTQIDRNQADYNTVTMKTNALAPRRDEARKQAAGYFEAAGKTSGKEADAIRATGVAYKLQALDIQAQIDAANQERDDLKKKLDASTKDAKLRIEIANEKEKQARLTAATTISTADAAIAQRAQETTVPMPEGGNADIRTGIAARQTRLAQGNVMALTRENDGTVTPRGGGATQQAGQQALTEAGRRVAAGADEAQVLLDLAQKLKEQGVVYKGGFSALADAIDSMDGEQGTIKARLAKLESQGKSARGLD